jgi:hypothetical protein
LPLTGPNPRKLIEEFGKAIRDLYGSCLNPQPPLQCFVTGNPKSQQQVRGAIGFGYKERRIERCPLPGTKFELYVNHSVLAKPLDGKGSQYQLKSQKYSYKILVAGSGNASALIRWEFERDKQAPHIQVRAKAEAGDLNFDRLHTATGWVTFEAVLRFAFEELGATPNCADWHDRLEKSRRQFRAWAAPLDHAP